MVFEEQINFVMDDVLAGAFSSSLYLIESYFSHARITEPHFKGSL